MGARLGWSCLPVAGGILLGTVVSCWRGPYIPGSGTVCPTVLYEPVGELVHDPEDCGANTCPLYCDEGVCGKGNSRGYWCEPCERVDAYLAGDGSVCWVVWDDDGSTNLFCSF